jgi:histidinol-phosphate aminotransferase
MSRFFDLVSRPAREMGEYSPRAPLPQLLQKAPLPRLIKLDSNENPFGPSPRAVEAMRSALPSAHAYPDDDCKQLRDALATHHDLPREQVLVTAGSTALLGLLCQTLLEPGLNAVTSERSFIVYRLAAQAAGAHLVEAPMREDECDPAAMLNAIDHNTRLVFLANPNNPTGTMLDASVVDRFLANIPAHVVLVLDEAYAEYAAHFAAHRGIAYSRSLDYVRHGSSVVVLRTFSKAHGLAGLRVGYGLGPAELLAYCARMRNTFSVSSVAQAAALAAIDDRSHIERVVANNATEAKFLTDELSSSGFRVTPASANFVYCDLGADAYEFAGRLRAEGVSVRPLGAWGAPHCIRVSIGTPEQNRFFLQAVRNLAKHTMPRQKPAPDVRL